MNALTSTEMLASTSLSAPADDTAIIALATKMLAGEHRLADWDADRCELTTEEASDLSTETGRQADMLMTMEPRSLVALAAKVQAFRVAFHSMVVTEPGDTIETASDFKDHLAWSIFGDVLRLADTKPDAELLGACADFASIHRDRLAHWDEENGDDGDHEDENNHRADAWMAALDRVEGLRFTTIGGMLAKLRACHDATAWLVSNDARDPDASMGRFHSGSHDWLTWSVLRQVGSAAA